MAYLVIADLIARFGADELTQRADRAVPRLVTPAMLIAFVAGDTSGLGSDELAAVEAVAATLQGVIGDAVSTVDGYLAARYALPLSPVPASVSRYTADIARYYLYDDNATETIQKRYDAAMAYLRDVASGKAALGSAENAELPAQNPARLVQVSARPRVFGRDE